MSHFYQCLLCRPSSHFLAKSMDEEYRCIFHYGNKLEFNLKKKLLDLFKKEMLKKRLLLMTSNKVNLDIYLQ